MIPTRIFKLFRDSHKCCETKKNRNELNKKIHQEKEFEEE